MKITPAMRAHCRRLLNPTMCKWVKASNDSLSWYGQGVSPDPVPNYPMMRKIETAGLIEWVAHDDKFFKIVAVLTDAGKAAAQ